MLYHLEQIISSTRFAWLVHLGQTTVLSLGCGTLYPILALFLGLNSSFTDPQAFAYKQARAGQTRKG
jgi:hypothetical protein